MSDKTAILLFMAAAGVFAGAFVVLGVLPHTNFNMIDYGTIQAQADLLPLADVEHSKSVEKAGDAKQGNDYLNIDDQFVDTERSCEFCLRIEYTPGAQGVAGVAFKADNTVDLSGAKRVTFLAMGENGGEELKFVAAGKTLDTKAGNQAKGDKVFNNLKFAATTKKFTLLKDWRKYQIDLSNADLKDITHLFGFEVAKGKSVGKSVFYLQNVVFDKQPAEKALATE